MAFQCWEIRPGDYDLAKQIKKNFLILYARNPTKYTFEIANPTLRFLPLKRETRGVNFVIGQNIDNLLGYARCSEGIPAPLSSASRLPAFWRGKIFNELDRQIKKTELEAYGGFSEYKGGRLISVYLLESFRHRERIGSTLLDFIKDRYEMIELCCIAGTEKFYTSNDFHHTGLFAGENRHPILVWNRR